VACFTNQARHKFIPSNKNYSKIKMLSLSLAIQKYMETNKLLNAIEVVDKSDQYSLVKKTISYENMENNPHLLNSDLVILRTVFDTKHDVEKVLGYLIDNNVKYVAIKIPRTNSKFGKLTPKCMWNDIDGVLSLFVVKSFIYTIPSLNKTKTTHDTI
jgi:hypothetical protein